MRIQYIAVAVLFLISFSFLSISISQAQIRLDYKFEFKSLEFDENLGLGEQSAPVKVSVFFSYTCRHCKDAYLNNIDPMFSEYLDDGRLRIDFMPVAVDTLSAAITMLNSCTRERSRRAFTTEIFENQSDIASADNVAYRLKSIFDKYSDIEFNDCLSDEELNSTVVEQSAYLKSKFKIQQFPDFHVDGVRYIIGYMPDMYLEDGILMKGRIPNKRGITRLYQPLSNPYQLKTVIDRHLKERR